MATQQPTHNRKVAVIGLGYVGLPVAVAFGQNFRTIGFDVNEQRISSLKDGIDVTGEVEPEELKSADVLYTNNYEELKEADFFIVAVPTPIDDSNQPNLTAMKKASESVAKVLKKGDIVVYESTVYPGVTEDVCAPILIEVSGLAREDFKLGYSPERINPGDKEHTFTKITKVVSGEDAETLDIVSDVYASVVTAGTYKASTIKVAEAAKVIENTQRDLNIALMNELALIFHKMGIDTNEVIDAAATKWNFLPFRPGLVGGHCIGVDPYYLTHAAEKIGHIPQVILSGRRINDNMGKYVAHETVKKLIQAKTVASKAVVTVLGVTFKENCPDTRNSKVFDIIRELDDYGIEVQVTDAMAEPAQVKREYGIDLVDHKSLKKSDAIILAVAHKEYKSMTKDDFAALSNDKVVIMDVKSMLSLDQLPENHSSFWRL
jgi:UDP-N-acetyl-D-galactosamine dehydrogenase